MITEQYSLNLSTLREAAGLSNCLIIHGQYNSKESNICLLCQCIAYVYMVNNVSNKNDKVIMYVVQIQKLPVLFVRQAHYKIKGTGFFLFSGPIMSEFIISINTHINSTITSTSAFIPICSHCFKFILHYCYTVGDLDAY